MPAAETTRAANAAVATSIPVASPKWRCFKEVCEFFLFLNYCRGTDVQHPSDISHPATVERHLHDLLFDLSRPSWINADTKLRSSVKLERSEVSGKLLHFVRNDVFFVTATSFAFDFFF